MTHGVQRLPPVEVAPPLTRQLARAGAGLWLAAALLVPLALNPWGVSAFELPKAALVRALALGLLLVAMVVALERPSHRRALLRPAVAALPLALVLTAATLVSVDGRASLWGSHERQQGLITLLSYLLLFAATAGLVETGAEWDRLARALVWSSVPVVLYGFAQAIGLDPLRWQSDSASAVLSTLGRSNLLGSYLVLVVPLTAALAVPPGRRRRYLPLLAAQLVCLLLTRARSAYLGLAVATLVGAALWATEARLPRLRALVSGGGGLAPLLSLGLTVVVARVTPVAERLTALGGSIAARVAIWTAALPLVDDRPLLGYGPETLAPLFARVFPPPLVYYQGRTVYVDRAHNLGLDLALGAGLLGLLAFGLLLGWALWRLWSPPTAALPTPARAARVALTAALFGHLADLQFSFDLTGSATVLYLLLALAAAFPAVVAAPVPDLSAHRPGPVREVAPRTTERLGGTSQALLYLPPLLAVLSLAAMLSLRPTRADSNLWLALQAGATPVGLHRADQAASLMPREPTYRFAYARILAQAGRYADAVLQARRGIDLSPRDPRAWASLAELHLVWATVDPAQLAPAEAAYRTATGLAPNMAVYHTGLGLSLARQTRLEEAVSSWERAVALDATDYVSYDYLAQAYADLGRGVDADQAAEKARYWRDRTRFAAE